jgi:hypothetical protein
MNKTNKGEARRDRFARAKQIEESLGMPRYLLEKYARLGYVHRKKSGKGRGAAVFYNETEATKVWDSLRDGYDPEFIADWDGPLEGGAA